MKKTHVFIIVILLIVIAMLCGCLNSEAPKRKAKQEIVVACGKDETRTIEGIMNDFTSQSSSTQVKLIELSNESRELYRAVSSMLAGKEVQLDAMLIEDIWVNEFTKNGYLEPLDDMISFNGSEYHSCIADFARKDGKLYWYPIILDTGIMYYRDDMSDGSLDYRSLTEQNSISYAVQGTDGEEMLCCTMEFVNLTDSVEEGIKLYKKAIEGAAVSTNPVNGLLSGDAAYARAWARESSGITKEYAPASAKVSTRVLKKENNESYATARTYGFAANAASNKKDNIKELLNYLTDDSVQMRIIKDMGTLPLRRADYENPLISYYSDYIEATYPLFETLKFRPNKANYTHLSRQAGTALSEYISGEGSLEDAAEAMTRLLDRQ